MKPTSQGWSRQAPDVTLAELQAALKRRFGITARLSTIHNTLRRRAASALLDAILARWDKLRNSTEDQLKNNALFGLAAHF
jgi:hypothetical protein